MTTTDQRPVRRVLIIDDQPAFSGFVKEVLAPRPEFRVIGEAVDGMSGFELITRLAPDVVLLDIELPDVSGLELAPSIRSKHPSVKLIMMSGYHSREYRKEALRAGAHEFIDKLDFSAERLSDICQALFAVKGAAAGD